ncbi:MAG: hypothetical protein H0W90_06675 [Actinobacteria bacterium]|nr:hypothetical protein [Actinomycetota bacterium]
MTELERALVLLGSDVDYPAEPDLRSRVRERIARKRRVRRALVFAVALVVVAFGIALAVPDARSAILRFFHIGAVTIERVETLPAARERPLAAGLGPVLSRQEAEASSGVPLVLSAVKPSRYYAQPGLIATLLEYRGMPILLAEISGDQTAITKKFVTPETHVEPAEIGSTGLWIEGGRHVVIWQTPAVETIQLESRLAGNVLLWVEGDRTFRLEGDLDKGQMLQLARDITR